MGERKKYYRGKPSAGLRIRSVKSRSEKIDRCCPIVKDKKVEGFFILKHRDYPVDGYLEYINGLCTPYDSEGNKIYAYLRFCKYDDQD